MLVLKSPKFCVTYANREIFTLAGEVSAVFACRNPHIALETVDFLSEETETDENFICITGSEAQEFFRDSRKIEMIWQGNSGGLTVDGFGYPLNSTDSGGAISEAFDILRGTSPDIEFLA